MTVEASPDRECKQANTATGKKETLSRGYFPPNDEDQGYELPQAGSAHTCVIEEAVERAVYSESVKKAPAQTSCLVVLSGNYRGGI